MWRAHAYGKGSAIIFHVKRQVQRRVAICVARVRVRSLCEKGLHLRHQSLRVACLGSQRWRQSIDGVYGGCGRSVFAVAFAPRFALRRARHGRGSQRAARLLLLIR